MTPRRQQWRLLLYSLAIALALVTMRGGSSASALDRSAQDDKRITTSTKFYRHSDQFLQGEFRRQETKRLIKIYPFPKVATAKNPSAHSTETAQNGSVWSHVGPSGMGVWTSIDCGSAWCFAGAESGGLFRTKAGEWKWQPVDATLSYNGKIFNFHIKAIRSLALDPNNAQHVIMALVSPEPGALFESTDGGKIWSRHDLPDNAAVEQLLVLKKQLVILSRHDKNRTIYIRAIDQTATTPASALTLSGIENHRQIMAKDCSAVVGFFSQPKFRSSVPMAHR